jgi:nucleoside-diphosphate-sugar epimerase
MINLRSSTALVTGASGFVGGHVAQRLARNEGMRVRALMRNPSGATVTPLDHEGIERVRGDLLDASSLAAACRDCDFVIHLAADTTMTDRRATLATSVDGTRHLLRAAQEAGVQRLVFMSTFDVYFGALRDFRDEDTVVVPYGDAYADGKIAAEKLLLSAPPGAPSVVILRPPAVFGPGSREWTLQFLADIQRDRLWMPGGGRFPFPYLYIDNLVDAVVCAASASAAAGIYNIVDGRMSYREFVQPLVELAGGRVRPIPFWLLWPVALASEATARLTGRWQPLTLRRVQIMADRPRARYASADKARRELGWETRVDFATAFSLTAAWLREQGYVT